jgi:hypothetical protein
LGRRAITGTVLPMIVEIAIPELTLYPNGFPRHWLNIIFLGNRPDSYKLHAITTTYVRLVEGAYVHYRLARQCVHSLWNTHNSLAIGSHNLSATYFEDCINSMHRAVLCMKGIRGRRDVPADLKGLLPRRSSQLTPLLTVSGIFAMPFSTWISWC